MAAAPITRIARETGRPVTVGHGDDLGLDTSAVGGGAWYTVCDDHGFIISHLTLALARSHASNPLGWCEVCMGNYDPDAAIDWDNEGD